MNAFRSAMTVWAAYVLGRHGMSVHGGFPGITAVWGSIEFGVAGDRLLRRRRGRRS